LTTNFLSETLMCMVLLMFGGYAAKHQKNQTLA
jgi:hypothetical protein